MAIGFSHNTCLPASAAAMVCARCKWTGVATYTASISSSTIISWQFEYHFLAPNCLANDSPRWARARLIATRSHPGKSHKAGATRRCAISPQPTSPQLTFFIRFAVEVEFILEIRSASFCYHLHKRRQDWFLEAAA